MNQPKDVVEAKRSPFLTARWHDLVMVNYEVDPGILLPYVPRGVALDSWQGKALVSIVGFRFLDTRVLGLPVPFHRHFEELNLRFYVRRQAPGGLRRGVVFIKELVPRQAIAWLARTVYGENYTAVPMRHQVPGSELDRQRYIYQWRFGGWWHQVAVTAVGAPSRPPDDAEETFISEHYWGYARQRDGSTMEYRVEHPRWQVRQATDVLFHSDVASLYGPQFAPFLDGSPSSAFVADGSAVIVRQGQRLDA